MRARRGGSPAADSTPLPSPSGVDQQPKECPLKKDIMSKGEHVTLLYPANDMIAEQGGNQVNRLGSELTEQRSICRDCWRRPERDRAGHVA